MMERARCEGKVALLAAYQAATKTYSEAVFSLNSVMGTSTKEEYDARYRMTEALRLDAVRAKEDLEHHIAKHQC
jgi:hypothetical protein